MSLQTTESSGLQNCYRQYQSDAVFGQYCDSHYGPERFDIPNFPKQLADYCLERMQGETLRALDLGCALGRSSFELARGFGRIDAVDFSSRFIDACRRIAAGGRVRYRLVEEGEVEVDCLVSLADVGLDRFADKVFFRQGDVANLPADVAGYDLILAANLIDRLEDPGRFLATIHHRMNAGGLLAIASPYDWKETYTPIKRWLGGRLQWGRPLDSFATLEKLLEDRFVLFEEPAQVNFLLRKTARTFSLGISELSFWQPR